MSKIRMSASQHEMLKRHLFPGDELEAAAILICGQIGQKNQGLCVYTIIQIPHNECKARTPTRLSWPGSYLEEAIDEADLIGGSIVLMHSHPGCMFEFSDIDDASDRLVIPTLMHGSKDSTVRHGSAVMVPNGEIKARMYDQNLEPTDIQSIVSVGASIKEHTKGEHTSLAFSSSMTKDLSAKTACVIGVSGTGSIVAEMLARLGVGHLVLIDFDKVETKNLNRILNTDVQDIGCYKTEVCKSAIFRHHPEIAVISVRSDISAEAAILAASDADVIFSCVDSMNGRYYCDLLSQSFVCPLIDIGVVIPTRIDERGYTQITDVFGRIDYVYPGSASLWERGQITGEGLAAEYLKKAEPQAFLSQVNEGYLKGTVEEAPSVITVNMQAASLGVNEWLARLYEFRHVGNEEFSRIFFALGSLELEFEQVPPTEGDIWNIRGRGLAYPLLNLPELSQKCA
jgi:hypothetical protein